MDKPKKLYLRQLDNLFKDVRMLIILQRKTNVNLKAGLKRTASFEEWLLMLSTVLLCAVLSPIWLCTIPQTEAHQAPLSMGLSRQEYWRGLPLPSPRWAPHYLCSNPLQCAVTTLGIRGFLCCFCKLCHVGGRFASPGSKHCAWHITENQEIND